jgi:transcriptional regulator with XRE-family HTH domain
VLSENLRILRHSHQLSQEGLGEISGLHRTYIGAVERGERNVTLGVLDALAQAFGVTVHELLTPNAYDDL